MSFVVLLFFITMMVSSYKKRGWNIASYMYLLYSVTTFFSCMIKVSAPDSSLGKIELSLFPSIVYCVLIAISIYPFSRIGINNMPVIQGKALSAFDFIAKLYIGLFFVMLILFASNIKSILQNGDFYFMRAAGGVSALSGVNTILRTMIIALGEFSSLMIFFFFYSITFLKKSKIYNLLILMSSLCMVMLGIMNIDRSRTFYWVIITGLSFTIFQPHLKKELKRKIIILFSIIGFILFSYFITVSISRFDRADSSLEDGLLSYAGQPYINFCDFFDNYKPPFVNFHFFFPNIYHFFIDGYSTAVEIGLEVESKTGRFVNVFYTFLGSILLDSGRFFMVVFVILFFCISKLLIGRNNIDMSFWRLMRVFLLALIPSCGIILYYLSSPIMALGYYFLMYLTYWGENKNR